MKRITASTNSQRWPRCKTASVETRKRDLVIRIADWSHDHDEPAFDVECYIGGIYDDDESKTFPCNRQSSGKRYAKAAAIAFAARQIRRLL